MKKLLSLITVVSILLSATVAFASPALKVSEAEKANPKIWIEYLMEDSGMYFYNVNYDAGTALTTTTNTGNAVLPKYTGTGISSLDFQLSIDESIWNVTEGMIGGAGVESFADASCAYNANQKRLVFTISFTNPTKNVGVEKGTCAMIMLTPNNAEGFDPEAVKVDFASALMQIDAYANAKTAKNSTEYSNLGSADYAINATINSVVLTDDYEGKVEGTQIVAHTKNVEGVKATTTVDVTYEGETKTFGDFGTLLGISGEGTADGTVRFAVKAPASFDPNGFLFKVNY